jgi:hypothetical protein
MAQLDPSPTANPASGVGDRETNVLPPEKGTHAMLNNLSRQIGECLQHAEDCARQAAAQSCPKLKADFLDMERRCNSPSG